ncbi:MAG: hypothetical protein CUN49_05030 [Candidatus Thermofonsia Clade 1 bacterium]|jgi:hypothetical protein|uniref:Serine kinase n=1 Tax=Candidatus Thermofonsia Clade 1 bacterium TaxID=2364210 RepID=A0A2M8PG34_9CHLR|nr:MAG: hypothetical protein CUN49_05030 [Candidatus Thermofonsia Clade 1 bacterium]
MHIPTQALYQRKLQIIHSVFQISTNAPWLVQAEEYFGTKDVQSLLTNYHSVSEAPESAHADAEVLLLDLPDQPLRVHVAPRQLWISGDLSALERDVRDRRYSIFGNMGLFFRYSLAALQRFHGIVSMHASSFYHPERNELLIVGGGSGAGKSVYLFEGLRRGYQVFTAEMTFFRIDADGVHFYKGALHDNVWTGSIQGEFADVIREKLGVQHLEQRQNFLAKAVIDLTPAATAQDVISNPKVLLLLSRLEQDRPTCSVTPIDDARTAACRVYEVASEKLQSGYVLYERYAAPNVDDAELQAQRFALCLQFVQGSWLRGVRKVVAGNRNCMEAVQF